jgi:sulfatase maturation enzyme AslB (radical SAM superfamily)
MHLLSVARRRLHEGISYRLRTFAGGRLSSYCRPTSIVLLLTERCNARCIHCDIWKNRGQEDRPSLSQWRVLIADLRDWLGPVQITLSGGEALLNRDTVRLLSFGSSLGLFMELLTHGFWEDQSKIESLALAGPSRVTISFDGIAETHDRVRGRVGFVKKTERTIQTLKRMRKEHRLDMVIRLKTVIMRQNLDDIGEVARFAQQEKANGDVIVCNAQPAIGNIKTTPIREIWQNRPRWWEGGCCLERRLNESNGSLHPVSRSVVQPRPIADT